MFSILPLFILPLFVNENCAQKTTSAMKEDSTAVRYVALGDSYTIGEGASVAQSWPALIAAKFSNGKTAVQLVANPSRTGWTTQDLIDRELPVFDTSRADVVSLLIGVNDWVQGVDAETFSRNLSFILDHVASKLLIKKNILLVTIPDFGVTPTGKMYAGGRSISQGISAFNAIIRSEATKRNLPLVDIFSLTQQMGNDSSLVAADGLHPSAKEYALWAQMILPVFEKMVAGN